MTEQEVQNHILKESLKQAVKNGQSYTDKMKSDLLKIIDFYKSPEEICKAILVYFAMIK